MFSTNDYDFTENFYKFVNESNDKKLQEKKLQEKNNAIICENIALLEDCLKKNMNLDNTIPYDKTFTCTGFKFLRANNNNDTSYITDHDTISRQYEKCLSNINLTYNRDLFISPKNSYSTYSILGKKFRFINYIDHDYNIQIRMSNKL